MERAAKFLRKPHPYGMPGYPQSTQLARMLDDAARYFRTTVEPTRNIPGVLKFGRQSQAHMIFISSVSNEVKEIRVCQTHGDRKRRALDSNCR
jgi:hypothetical protein